MRPPMQQAIDVPLWHACQRIAWPRHALPSEGTPYPPSMCSPRCRPASWLYWTLLADGELRSRVLTS